MKGHERVGLACGKRRCGGQLESKRVAWRRMLRLAGLRTGFSLGTFKQCQRVRP